MPELPDIEVFSQNLKKRYIGRVVKKVEPLVFKKLKDEPGALRKRLEGKKLEDVYRFGKELRFLFSGNVLMGMHLMLTGDLFAFQKQNDHKWTIIAFNFDDGSGLALTDRMKNASVKLDPENKKGIDALQLTYKQLKEILDRNANIKNVLLDQNRILGIGNSYSDEILWKSGISPFSVASAIPDEKVKELARNIRQVLKGAVQKISKKYPGLIQGEVKDFLRIHTRRHTGSPTGAPLQMVKRGMLKTFYTNEQVVYQ